MTSDPNRITRLDIFEETWYGVVRTLESLYSAQSLVIGRGAGRNIAVVPAATAEEFEKKMQDQNRVLELPVIVVSPTAVSTDPGSYNLSVMRRNGVATHFDKTRQMWVVPKLAPALLTFQVMLVTDDILTLMRMIDRWISNELWTFTLQWGDWGTTIQVLVDKNMAVPQRQMNSGGADQYRLVTTLQVKTYAGFVWQVPAIRKIELETLIPDGTIESALLDPAVLSTVVNVRDIDAPLNQPVPYEPIN